MWRDALRGLVAGAAGTATLNLVTYGDITLRGRPPSSVPTKLAGKLTERLGVELASGDKEDSSERAQNRQQGLGALFGYATGLSIGTAYGLLRPHLGKVSQPLAGAVLGLLAMAGSDVPSTALGLTNPKSWGASGWASDLIPHLAYGLVTVFAYEALAGR